MDFINYSKGRQDEYIPEHRVTLMPVRYESDNDLVVGKPLHKRTPLQKGILIFGGLVGLAMGAGIVTLAVELEKNRNNYSFESNK